MQSAEQSPEQLPVETPDQPETPTQPLPPQAQRNSQARLFRLPSLTPKARGRLLWVIGGVLAVVLIGCIVGAVVLAVSSKNVFSNAASNPTASTTSAPTSAPTQQAEHHKVGDTISTASWQVTINSASAYDGNPYQFDTPRAGDTFLVVKGTFKNLTDQSQPLSTLLFFTLQDTQGNTYPEAVLNSVSPPDSPVLANEDTQGEWGYEVPTSIHAFVLIFSDGIGQTTSVWDISI